MTDAPREPIDKEGRAGARGRLGNTNGHPMPWVAVFHSLG